MTVHKIIYYGRGGGRNVKEDTTKWQQIEHNTRIANRNASIAVGCTIINILLFILAYLDKITDFVCYVLSCQH